jgi:hypothetical protein
MTAERITLPAVLTEQGPMIPWRTPDGDWQVFDGDGVSYFSGSEHVTLFADSWENDPQFDPIQDGVGIRAMRMLAEIMREGE